MYEQVMAKVEQQPCEPWEQWLDLGFDSSSPSQVGPTTFTRSLLSPLSPTHYISLCFCLQQLFNGKPE